MARFSRRAILTTVGVVIGLGLILVVSTAGGKKKLARISHGDPEVQAAAKRAQNQIDIFLKEIQKPTDGDQFFVRGGFKAEGSLEYLWVKRVTYDRGVFTGILDEPPTIYQGAKRGDEVKVKQEDVYDWMIKNGDFMQGGYTEKVLNGR